MAKADDIRIAVLGAGPIGIETALYARKLGLNVTVYERGSLAEHVQRWGHIRLFTPFGWNASALGLATLRSNRLPVELPAANDLITGTEFRDVYLLPLCQHELLAECIRTETVVVQVARQGCLRSDPYHDPRRQREPFRLLLQSKEGERIVEADAVFDCTGTYGQPNYLGDGGIPALGERAARSQIAYGLEDILGSRKSYYAGKSVLVIGGGYSAATTVCQLAALAEEHPATWVIWLTRGPRSQPLPRIPGDPLRERDRLALRANSLATRGEGNVEYHPQSFIEQIVSHGPDKGFRVVARQAGKPFEWDVDRVIANVGYSPDWNLLRELHVHPCDLFDQGSVGSSGKQPEPNLWVLGAKSHGRQSSFLLRQGFDQIREAFAQLLNKPNLDLYTANAKER